MLTDEQIKELGVVRMGDRAALVEACKRASLGSRISQEVKKIMQPSQLSTVQQSGARIVSETNAFPSGSGCRIPVDNRRRKRRSCLAQSRLFTTNGGPQPSFSKKLFVFRCMGGPSIPRSFTRKDKDIIARGFVSDICVSATEEEVRQEIHAVLANSGLPQTVGPNDFEFIDVNGKVAFVPSIKEDFEFNGRIVKQLAGAGSLYVRLLYRLDQGRCKDKEEVCIITDDDESDLPVLPFKLRRSSHLDVNSGTLDSADEPVLPHTNEKSPLVKSGNYSAVEFSCVVAQSDESPSTASDAAASDYVTSRSGSDVNTLPGPSKLPTDIQQLTEPFPNFPEQFITTLYAIADCDFVATLDCLLKGDLPSVLSLVKDNVMRIDPINYNSTNIYVPAESTEEFDWAIAAFSFYKSHKFNPRSDINVMLGGQPAIDIGGVRRTFFSVVYEKVASGYLNMFEGPRTRLRPVFRMSVLNSGILKIFGQMIGHTLVMDGLGFPYLSPACYYYMAGKWNIAITLITDEDVSSRVGHVLKQLREGQNIDSFEGTELMELLEQSGSDIALKEENKEKICQSLLVYDTLLKRKAFLDSISEGLEIFKVRSLISSHPKMFEKKFVGCAGTVTKKDVKDLIRTSIPPGTNHIKLQLLHAIGIFIDESTEEDLRKFLLFCTGCQEVLCNRLTIDFTDDELAPALSANTCSRVLCLSLRITPPLQLVEALRAVIQGTFADFTMV